MSRRVAPRVLGVALLAASLGGLLPQVGAREVIAASPATPAASPCPATSEADNAALVRQYLNEAYNGRNPALADELLADDFVRHSLGSPHRDQAAGNADDAARITAWLTAFPDLAISIEQLITADDTVVAYLIWRGTNDGPLPHWGAPTTGQPMERESMVIYRIACGRIAENWIVQDNLSMLRQLGVISDDELAGAAAPVATPAP